MTREPLTSRQRVALDFVALFLGSHGYPPTLREIAKRMGFTSTNAANDHLVRLERKGYIARVGFASRGIRLIDYDGACPTCGLTPPRDRA